MKDAKGHGSDRGAHAGGIEGATSPQYEWAKQGGSHYLIPSSDNGARANVANAIGRVEPHVDSRGAKGYKATLLTSFSTGNGRLGNWALHGSVGGAKNWIGSTSANSWAPPNIKK